MEPITASVAIWGVIIGLIGNQVDEEVSNKLIKNNIKKWLQKTSRPINHDIERAIRKAELNATLIFLKEYISNYRKKKSFIKLTPSELIQIRKYLQKEIEELSKPTFVPPEILINFEIEELLKPNKYSIAVRQFKNNIIEELTKNVDSLPKEFQDAILNGIEIDNDKVDWYDLMSSFFIETVKTNERVKTAIENDFLVDIKEDIKQQNLVLNLSFTNLSSQISDSNKVIIAKIDGVDTKLDEFLEQLANIIKYKNGTGGVNLNPEVLHKKSKINKQIEKLTTLVTVLQKNNDTNAKLNNSISLENIDFEDIIDALKNETCILFLGPEISTDENGNSLHEKYFESICNNQIKYNSNDGFFLPGSENKIINKSKQFYSNIFPLQNKSGNAVLEKLAQIPFKLIMSYSPDDSMSRIYKKYNINHKCFEYIPDTQTHVERETNIKEPIIYNAFGNAAKNGKYIYSHRQFNEFSKAEPQKRIPINIESELIEGTNFLFIGFDFNKWYLRAMMFDLNIMDYSDRMVIDAKNKTEELNKDFIKKQFDVSFIDTEYHNFTNILLTKSKDSGLSKLLDTFFSDSILKEIDDIRQKSIDTDKLKILSELFLELENIEIKIMENKG